MIGFITVITITTAIFASLFFLVQKKVVTIYRGGFFIVLSGLYFSTVFAIAHLMRESFK
jgi:hypothetical protein